MTPKSVAASILVGFALVCVGVLVFKETRTPTLKEPPAPKGRVLTVFYFHGDARCASCDRIESYAREAVQTAFDDQIRAGRVEWHAVDTDRPENAHFVKDYGLLTRSIVLSDRLDGREKRWKNLDRVWELLGDRKAFQTYVQDEVAGYLVSP